MNVEVSMSHHQAEPRAEAAKESDPATTMPAFHSAAEAARIAELELELNQMRDRWMRAEAEIANVRARSKRDIDETRQFAIQKFASDVVEMAENLQRGVTSLPVRSDREPDIITRLRDGFNGIEQSFVGLLARNGIARQDPTGAAFDPGLHQAMDQRVSAGHAPGTVLQAWTSAWTLNGRLLRPAMVVVSVAAPPPRPPGGSDRVPSQHH